MSQPPFMPAFLAFKAAAPKLFEWSDEENIFHRGCPCPDCNIAKRQREKMLETAFSSGFNAGVLAQGTKEMKK